MLSNIKYVNEFNIYKFPNLRAWQTEIVEMVKCSGQGKPYFNKRSGNNI